MKLTKKKKMLIASAAIRDIQILSLSILQYKSIASELKPIIRDEFNEDVSKAIFNIFANSNLLNSKLNEVYSRDKQANQYLQDADGLTHLEEMSTQVLEKMNEVIANYKV
jgi:hypothetical protein